jgi:protein-disulfide isomerase
VKLLRRSFLVLLLICMGCVAQSKPSDLTQKIETQVRSFYNIPAEVKVEVGPLQPSEFANYDSVTINLSGEGKKKVFDFLVSRDQKTLIRLTKMDLTKDPYSAIMSKIDLSNRPTRGNNDAKVVVVNFDDFECPFCSRMHQTLFPEILKEYGDRVKFVYKDYPISEIHPWSMHAAVDAHCLAVQSNDAYWDFADYIHANQREVGSQKSLDGQVSALDRITTEQGKRHSVDDNKLQACMKAQDDSTVKASIHEAEELGVSATPTLFINGQELDGALSLQDMRTTLDRALTRAGVPAPQRPGAGSSSGDAKPSGQ